jgi:DNA-binding SARP family transcriptional activator
MFRTMTFEVLGPVRGRLGDAELDLGSPQQRAVLAMLLLARGRQVPLERLVDGLWERDAPRAAGGTVRTYVSRLRRLLKAHAAERGGCGIALAGDGYALHLGSAVLDLDEFEERLRSARDARRGHEEAHAAAILRSALDLWRGDALAGLPGPYAESRRAGLAELHRSAQQEKLALDIATGEHAAAAAELRSLLAEHRFHEGLSELLMHALYKGGRQADALAVYDETRRGLRDELGVDPGPALQQMHQRILRADGRLMGGAAAPSADRRHLVLVPPVVA